MSKYAHIRAKVLSETWLATPDVMESITSLINTRVSGERISIMDAEDDEPNQKMLEQVGSVAVLNVSGVIGKRLSSMETMCGGVDVDAVRTAFDAANTDGNVSAIVLHVDSPGGAVTGVPELAAHITATKGKPVVAYTDTLMASGGYWLASAADAIYSAETARVGSIGAIVQIVDESDALSRMGVKVHTFKSGAWKDLGNSTRSMTDDEKSYMQSRIDAIGSRFRDTVKVSRPLVDESALDAKVYDGNEALMLRLVDGIFNTRAELISHITT